jgi:hypothetical protein
MDAGGSPIWPAGSATRLVEISCLMTVQPTPRSILIICAHVEIAVVLDFVNMASFLSINTNFK